MAFSDVLESPAGRVAQLYFAARLLHRMEMDEQHGFAHVLRTHAAPARQRLDKVAGVGAGVLGTAPTPGFTRSGGTPQNAPAGYPRFFPENGFPRGTR